MQIGDKAPKHYAAVHVARSGVTNIGVLQSALRVMLEQVKGWPENKPYDMRLTDRPDYINLEISSRD